MNLEEIKEILQKRIDKIEEKTNKKITMHFENFNTMYITIDNKKFNFMIPREMQAFVNGMYFILK